MGRKPRRRLLSRSGTPFASKRTCPAGGVLHQEPSTPRKRQPKVEEATPSRSCGQLGDRFIEPNRLPGGEGPGRLRSQHSL